MKNSVCVEYRVENQNQGIYYRCAMRSLRLHFYESYFVLIYSSNGCHEKLVAYH